MMKKYMNMKNLSYIILFLLAGVCMSSCQEKVVMLYENDPRLYFYKGTDYTNGITQRDSIVYSFYTKETTRMRDTVYVNIRTMGLPEDYARQITLKQTNAGKENAAVAGTHYVAFDDNEVAVSMVIPANAVMTNIPIILLRDRSMKFAEYRMELEIVENEEFGIALETQKNFLIKVSDMTAPPANWNSTWIYVFGEWGAVKMKFIIDYLGFTDFDNYSQYSSEEYNYFKMKANQKLEEYNATHPVLTEDDGITLVEFPK